MMSASRSRRLVWAIVVVVAVLVTAVLSLLYIRGGGPIAEPFAFLRPAETNYLAPSAPAEQVLRAVRLAGIDRAIVGENGRAAVARVEVPAADSSADITTAWLAALGALEVAYPDAGSYVVQVFAPGAVPLVELQWSGENARSTDDGAQLRSRAAITMLTGGAR